MALGAKVTPWDDIACNVIARGVVYVYSVRIQLSLHCSCQYIVFVRSIRRDTLSGYPGGKKGQVEKE